MLHQKVACVALGDEFTVVVTGDGRIGPTFAAANIPTSLEGGKRERRRSKASETEESEDEFFVDTLKNES